MHVKVAVNLDLEPALHLLVVDLVFLAGKLFLIQINNIWPLRTHIHLEVLDDSILDQLHLLHHQGLRPLSALHIGNASLFYAVKNLLLRGLVYVVEDLELGSLGDRTLPLSDVRGIKRLVVINEVSQIVSGYRHCLFLF